MPGYPAVVAEVVEGSHREAVVLVTGAALPALAGPPIANHRTQVAEAAEAVEVAAAAVQTVTVTVKTPISDLQCPPVKPAQRSESGKSSTK